MAGKNKWNVVLEGIDEDGRATIWSKEINHYKYGRYVWVTLSYDEYEGDIAYDVEVMPEPNKEEIVLKTCKTLSAAKRWATMNLDVEVESSGSIDDEEPCETTYEEFDINKEFDSRLAEFDIAETDIKKEAILDKTLDFVYNLVVEMDRYSVEQVRDIADILRLKCERFMVESGIDKNVLLHKLENIVINLDELLEVVKVLSDKFHIDRVIHGLKCSKQTVTEYSILLGVRNKALSYIRQCEPNITDYGLLKSIEKTIYDCGVDLDIVDLINEAYIYNEEFNKAMVDMVQKRFTRFMNLRVWRDGNEIY